MIRKLTFCAILALIGCGGSGSSNSNSSTHQNTKDPRILQAELVYADRSHVPSNFFTESEEDYSGPVQKLHLKSSDMACDPNQEDCQQVPLYCDPIVVDCVEKSIDPTSSYELCARDIDEAYVFSNEAGWRSSTMSHPVSVRDGTDKYFEIERVEAFVKDRTPALILHRVFNCNYIDREGVDTRIQSGFAGVLKQHNRSVNDIDFFAEYMWQFSNYNNANTYVVNSTRVGNEHTIKMVTINRVSQGCDSFVVTDWVYNVNPNTWEMYDHISEVDSFRAVNENGVVRICS